MQILYLLKQLHWERTVANDLLVTLNNFQLISDLILPVLEFTSPLTDYIEDGFLQSLCHQLHKMQASLWVENAWTPSLQQVGDESLMAWFSTIPGIKLAHLRQANTVQLYLQVITIADLCNPTGLYIPHGMLNGNWHASSDLLWPQQPQPPRSYFWVF
jgi:hypothetical protein